MNTLISVECFKLRHSRAAAIVILICTLLSLIFIIDTVESHTGPSAMEGVHILGRFSSIWQIAILGFIGFFCALDFSTDTIRNPVAIGKSRSSIYLSRVLISCIMIALLLVFLAIFTVVVLGIATGFGDMASGASLMTLLSVVCKQVLAHCAFAGIFVMFVFISRSPAVTILIGFCYIIFIMLLPSILMRIGDGQLVELMRFSAEHQISRIGTEAENTALAIGVPIVILAFTSAIGVGVFSKKDVR